ncbi:hypothetical protein D3C87_2171120 [compost metagenome]
MIDPRHRFVIRPRCVAGRQRSQVVMAGKDFAYALPQTGIEIEHALDMRHGVLVVGVEP